MRSSRAAFAALLLLGSAGAAKATTVTQNLVGMISGSHTVDTLGLFGPAGANLTGQPISIYFKYTTEDLTTVKVQRNGYTSYRSQNSSSTPGSVLVTVTVNGKRLTYVPSAWANVGIPTLAPYKLFLQDEADSYYSQSKTQPGVQLTVEYLQAPTFGGPLSPTDDPVLNKVNDRVDFFPSLNTGGPIEQLSFFVSSASK